MATANLDDLREIVGEVVDLSDVTLSESAVIGQDVALDSQEMLRVLSRIESRYAFRFSIQDMAGLKTVGDLLATIERRTQA